MEQVQAQKTIVEILAEARSVAGKLAKVEEKAAASQKEVQDYNAKMMDMMTGAVLQTADNNIATLANEQKKHLRRLEAVRKNAGADAATLTALGAQISAEIARLTEPYAGATPSDEPSEDADETGEEAADE